MTTIVVLDLAIDGWKEMFHLDFRLILHHLRIPKLAVQKWIKGPLLCLASAMYIGHMLTYQKPVQTVH